MKKLNVLTVALLSGFFFLASVGTAFAEDHYAASVAKGGASWLSSADGTYNLSFPAAGGDFVVDVKTNINLSISSRPYWTSASSSEIGKLALTVRANTGKISRSGSLVLKTKDGHTVTYAVSQLGSNDNLLVNKKELNFYGDRLVDSLVVQGNIDYSMVLPDWISATDAGNGKILFTGNRLYDQTSRTDTVAFKAKDGTVLASIVAKGYYATSDWYEKPCFAVISDIHFGDMNNIGWDVRMPRVFKTLTSHDPAIRNIFVIGDLANSCAVAEYQQIVKYWDQYIPSSIATTFIRGNHDNFSSDGANRFTTYLKQPFNQYQDIDGYPFISIGCNSSQYRWQGSESATRCYSVETISFLEASLADAADKFPGKPIFVFQHILPKNTVVGSFDSDLAAYSEDLDGIFSKYPQVVDFSGHTHLAITDPHQISQLNYTELNDGSEKHDSNGTKWPGWKQVGAEEELDNAAVTEGFILHIDADDRVVIERWNTARNIKYPKDWILEPPFDGTNFTYKGRSGGSAPWWPTGAAITITPLASDSISMNFPQAIDDEEPYRYIINITNSSGTKVTSQVNQFALLNMGDERPDNLTLNFGSLPTATELTATVVAYDAYEHTVTLTKKFTLP